MIAHLTGRVLALGDDWTILEVGGVGFRVRLPSSTRARLPSRGEEASLHVHTHVRDDAIALFGFGSETERDLFEALIDVSGVGPRLALAILSSLTPGTLERAVRLGDIDALKKVSGVGKRTAERLIVELKDRLTAFREIDTGDGADRFARGIEAPAAAADPSISIPEWVEQSVRADWADAREALLGLGYSIDEADAALARVAGAASVDEPKGDASAEGAAWWVRRALAQMDGTAKAKRSV